MIAFTFQTDARRVHLPERYRTCREVGNRMRMRSSAGMWERVFTVLAVRAEADEGLARAFSAGWNQRPRPPACGRGPQRGAPAGEPGDHAIGRSRGGPAATTHLAADDHRWPPALRLTTGRAGGVPPPPR
ncbi:hypothetical protein ACFSJS_16550 [Streptomyces desertarenae]|uniref:Transposase n=1 Tax=Streptomyces desertarenae TaxID=2666184 RepID=A0ABW4PNE1_9ACTN